MTDQVRDQLLYQRKRYNLGEELLRSYFDAYPMRKPEPEVLCTGCWHGYVAVFEIKYNQLFVKDVRTFTTRRNKMASHLEQAFPDGNKLDWFTGLISLTDIFTYLEDHDYPADYIYEALDICQGNLKAKLVMTFDEWQELMRQ